MRASSDPTHPGRAAGGRWEAHRRDELQRRTLSRPGPWAGTRAPARAARSARRAVRSFARELEDDTRGGVLEDRDDHARDGRLIALRRDAARCFVEAAEIVRDTLSPRRAAPSRRRRWGRRRRTRATPAEDARTRRRNGSGEIRGQKRRIDDRASQSWTRRAPRRAPKP